MNADPTLTTLTFVLLIALIGMTVLAYYDPY